MSVKCRLSALDDPLRVVDAQGGLRHIGNRRVLRDGEGRDVGFRPAPDAPAHLSGPSCLSPRGARAWPMRMRSAAPFAYIAFALQVDFGHQRARGIQHRQRARSLRVVSPPISPRRVRKTRVTARRREYPRFSRTNTAPLAFKSSTTCLLCTISWRT